MVAADRRLSSALTVKESKLDYRSDLSWSTHSFRHLQKLEVSPRWRTLRSVQSLNCPDFRESCQDPVDFVLSSSFESRGGYDRPVSSQSVVEEVGTTDVVRRLRFVTCQMLKCQIEGPSYLKAKSVRSDYEKILRFLLLLGFRPYFAFRGLDHRTRIYRRRTRENRYQDDDDFKHGGRDLTRSDVFLIDIYKKRRSNRSISWI
jgi:hypothetical protein